MNLDDAIDRMIDQWEADWKRDPHYPGEFFWEYIQRRGGESAIALEAIALCDTDRAAQSDPVSGSVEVNDHGLRGPMGG